MPNLESQLRLPFAHLNLRRNPFGETDLADRLDFALIDVSEYVERLRKPGYAVQFLGDKGHGKTTHLVAIQAAFPESIYLHVGEDERPAFPASQPLLIDELQRVPPRQRRRLFRRPVSFAFGSHGDVGRELQRAGVEVETVQVGQDLTEEKLATILKRRIDSARRWPGNVPSIGRATVKNLVLRHGSDLRAIEQRLYDVFQQLAEIREVWDQSTMAKCEVSIEFDRANRSYHSGEEVTGSVVVKAHQDVRCNELAVEHFWQTHGRGNKDTGDRARTVLYEGEWRSGETARYPFRFIAPSGPATYRGTYLNVDHYVAARVDLPWAFDPKCQEEYLLTPTPPSYFAGTEILTPDALKIGSKITSASIPLAIVLIVLGMLCIFPFGIILIPAGLILLFFGIRNRLAEKRIGQVQLHFERTEVVPGERVPLRLSVRPSKPTAHNGITAQLQGKETARSGSGTNTTTHTHKLCEESIPLAAAGSISPESPLDLQVEIPIPQDAAYSFSASDNKVLWNFNIRIDIPRWPDWVHTQVLLVRPFPLAALSAGEAAAEPTTPRTRSAAAPSAIDAALPVEAIEAEPLATSNDRWQSPFEEPPRQPPPPVASPSAPNPITPQVNSALLLAALAEIAQTDRFGGRRDAKVAELAGQTFDCTIQVDNVSQTFGYVEDRSFREGRTVQGTLVGSDQKISMLFRDNRNGELDDVRRGDRFSARCKVVGWDDLYKRAELQEA